VIDYELKEVLIQVQDVSLKFPKPNGTESIILKPTTVEVRNIVRPGCITGQKIGVLGPSGIGKTQFSRILAGLKTPTTGSVAVLDTSEPQASPPKMIPVHAGLVGMVFQNYPLFSHRTVFGNLFVALEHNTKLTKSERTDKINDFLRRFDLTDKADLYPAQLSGGQRQRVAIIQELLSSEHFLVMDEPFTGLDPLMKDKVCELIDQVAALHEENTLIVVAHDIAALVAISDCLWLFGRERDASGAIIPGATIKKKYDLIERGLAWQPDISLTKAFSDFVREVKAEFKNL
jgi:ABC-type polar amino acid transport system ATPase subunit